MARQLTSTILRAQGRALTTLVGLLYAPYYVIYQGVIALGWLPADAADHLFGLIGILILPLGNGAIVYLAHHERAGVRVRLKQALHAATGYWGRLLAAYLAIGFIVMGWLLLTVVPGVLVMKLGRFESPWILLPFALAGLVIALPRYAFVESLIVTRDLGAWEARQRSHVLSQGWRWRIVAISGPVVLIPMITELGLGRLTSHLFANNGVFSGFCAGIGLGLLSSWLYMVATILLYALYCEASANDPKRDAQGDAGDREGPVARVLSFNVKSRPTSTEVKGS